MRRDIMFLWICSMEIADMAVRRHRFIREETQVLEYLKPKEEVARNSGSSAGRRRASGRMTEREEVLVPALDLLAARAPCSRSPAEL